MRSVNRAFTFVEMMAVLVVIGILAAVVVPSFGSITDEAKTAAAQSSLGAVRSGIAAYRSRAVITGADPFPDLDMLLAEGTVLQQTVPVNPFTKVGGVQLVDEDAARRRAVSSEGTYGWNYWFSNAADPPAAIFYMNCETPSTASDGAGAVKPANEL